MIAQTRPLDRLGLIFTLAAFAALALPSSAKADVAVERVSPADGEPGRVVDLSVFCGGCSPGLRLGVSLVPVERAPTQKWDAQLGAYTRPASLAPPRQSPYVFLGWTDAGRRSALSERRHLRFRIPNAEPGTYAFVIYCEPCTRGPRGSLIANTDDVDELLRIRGAPARTSSAGDSGREVWVLGMAAAALVILAVGGGLLLFRRRGSIGRAR
jgi:hypothetical protein